MSKPERLDARILRLVPKDPPSPEAIEAYELRGEERYQASVAAQEASRRASTLPIPAHAKELLIEHAAWRLKQVGPPPLSPTPARRTVQKWRRALAAGSGRKLLLLLGDVGTGKSIAAFDDYLRVSEAEHIGCHELVHLHRHLFGPEAQRFRQLRRCPLLVLDELGGYPGPAEHEQAAVFQMLHDRQDMPTIGIGNFLDVKTFVKRMGVRTADRMTDTSFEWPPNIILGDSLRGTGQTLRGRRASPPKKRPRGEDFDDF